MSNISVIIPVHKYSEEINSYILRAVDSVSKQTSKVDDLLFVGPTSVLENLPKFENFNVVLVENNDKTDFCSQINVASKEVKTKYFSVLEFDDVYHTNWMENVDKYIKFKPEYSIFLPIVTFVDTENKFQGHVNEIMWSMGFCQGTELGVVNGDILESYMEFLPNGAVFRTDDFIEIGGLKQSIKLSFWYEFLLRASNQNIKTFVIPKYGYFHTINREDSILSTEYVNMDIKERDFWVKLAKKEYYFTEERKEKYEYVPTKDKLK